eukprot:101711-Rhodomonas_salina.1
MVSGRGGQAATVGRGPLAVAWCDARAARCTQPEAETFRWRGGAAGAEGVGPRHRRAPSMAVHWRPPLLPCFVLCSMLAMGCGTDTAHAATVRRILPSGMGERGDWALESSTSSMHDRSCSRARETYRERQPGEREESDRGRERGRERENMTKEAPRRERGNERKREGGRERGPTPCDQPRP